MLETVVVGGEDDNEDDLSSCSMNSGTPIFLDTNSDPDEHFATTEEDIMSMNSSEVIIMDSVKTPAEDFEAMIDSGNSKDDKESNSSVELMEIEAEQAEQLLPPVKLTTNATSTTATAKPNTKTNKTLIVVCPQSSAKMQVLTVGSIGQKPITAPIVPPKRTAVYPTTKGIWQVHTLIPFLSKFLKSSRKKTSINTFVCFVSFISILHCKGQVDTNCLYRRHVGKKSINDTCDTG